MAYRKSRGRGRRRSSHHSKGHVQRIKYVTVSRGGTRL